MKLTGKPRAPKVTTVALSTVGGVTALDEGQSVQCLVSIKDQYGRDMTGVTGSWESDAPAIIAVIATSGVASWAGEGSANIGFRIGTTLYL